MAAGLSHKNNLINGVAINFRLWGIFYKNATKSPFLSSIVTKLYYLLSSQPYEISTINNRLYSFFPTPHLDPLPCLISITCDTKHQSPSHTHIDYLQALISTTCTKGHQFTIEAYDCKIATFDCIIVSSDCKIVGFDSKLIWVRTWNICLRETVVYISQERMWKPRCVCSNDEATVAVMMRDRN